MQIETQRLFLRDHLQEDWTDIHEYAKEPNFSEYDIWGPNSEEDTKKFVSDMKEREKSNPRFQYDLALVEKETSKVIGGVSLRKDAEKSVVGSLGYAVNPRFQKRGFATEAVIAMINFGFKKLELQIIWATCDVLNAPSYKVMERSGLKRVGQLVKHKEFKGQWHDSFRYEITALDYFERQELGTASKFDDRKIGPAS
jgi:RimJ/RimL family protein N-acetyltransferase